MPKKIKHGQWEGAPLGERWWVAYFKGFNLPVPQFEHRFAEEREWRFDLAWPDFKLAVEIQGGTWSRGRHVRPKGFIEDREKIGQAQMRGWVVLEVTWDQVRSGELVTLLQQAFAFRTKQV